MGGSRAGLFTHYPCVSWVYGLPSKTSCSALPQQPVNCLLPLKSQTPSPLFSFVQDDTYIKFYLTILGIVRAYVNSPWAYIKM